ncbi:hypothetical protein [Parasphingorhabdus sp.]|uniref:hypothetical protein n=1 Tax=Parasphingorhabdus sp. TaxID=2709688 RepID=UPI002B264F71|nr:hypothetical protein [Parasphingorhabdus sp.]
MSGVSVSGSFLYDRLFIESSSGGQLAAGLFFLFGGLIFFPLVGKLIVDFLYGFHRMVQPESMMSFIDNRLGWFFTFGRWFFALGGAFVAFYGTALLLAWSFAKAGLVQPPWSVSS